MTSSSSSSSPTSVRAMDSSNNNSFDKKSSPASPHPIGNLNNIPNAGTSSSSHRRYPIIHETRSLILRLSVLVGNLSSVFLRVVPLDQHAVEDAAGVSPSTLPAAAAPEIASAMGQILDGLIDIADSLSIDLEQAIQKKMVLNAKKYPVELCQGRAGKYTDYSSVTGITQQDGQSTLHLSDDNAAIASSDGQRPLNSLFVERIPNLTQAIGDFARDRHWSKFHLPRNLLLALLGELGELAELFQWKMDDEGQELKPDEMDKIGQEIADVTIYLIRLADVCGVGLSARAGVDEDDKKSSSLEDSSSAEK